MVKLCKIVLVHYTSDTSGSVLDDPMAWRRDIACVLSGSVCSESSTRFSKDALLYKSIRPSQALHAFRGRFVLATHLDVDCSTCISILPAYQGQVMKVLMKSLVDVSIAQGCHIRS